MVKKIEWPTREFNVQEALLLQQVRMGNIQAAAQIVLGRMDGQMTEQEILHTGVSQFWTWYNELMEAVQVVVPTETDPLGPFKRAFDDPSKEEKA